MKISLFLFTCMLTIQIAFSQQSVGIGTSTPAASAKLEVSSTTQGMLVPRMTTAQRIAISSPASGLLVFDMTTNSFWFKGGSTWVQLVDSVHTEVHRNGPSMIYTGMTDNVGIGVLAPANKLDLSDGSVRLGTHATNRPLYVTGDIGPNYNGIEFRHSFGTLGIGFGYNTIYAAGSNVYQDLGIQAKGAIGNLLFSTNDTERMRVTGDGRVGIGLTNPGATLEITRGTAPYGALQIDGTNYNSHFNYGTEENTYIRGGKPGANVIINEYGNPGNVGIGTANPLQKLHVAGNLSVDNNVGIGNTDPHAPLQFSNAIQNKKLVLYDDTNNDHQFFGFGINGGQLRYQASGDHAFYFGANSTTSNELMRIKYDGRVGIGVSGPGAMLEITRGTNAIAPTGTLQIDGTTYASHFNYGATEDTYIRGGIAGGKVIINDYGAFGNVGVGTDNPLQKLHVAGNLAVDNNLGIGHSYPHAPLQFANNWASRKIVMGEDGNNDNQFYGLGFDNLSLRYQVSQTTADHVFYAGTSSTTSNELARIKGDGNMTISGIIQSEWWIEPTLINGWTPFSSYPHPYFYKDKIGTVHLMGFLTLATNQAGVTMFVLPVGYRPIVLEAFPANTLNGVVGAIIIGTDGQVWVNYGPPGTPYSLSGITFRAN